LFERMDFEFQIFCDKVFLFESHKVFKSRDSIK
jgi:hypothetical protein